MFESRDFKFDRFQRGKIGIEPLMDSETSRFPKEFPKLIRDMSEEANRTMIAGLLCRDAAGATKCGVFFISRRAQPWE